MKRHGPLLQGDNNLLEWQTNKQLLQSESCNRSMYKKQWKPRKALKSAWGNQGNFYKGSGILANTWKANKNFDRRCKGEDIPVRKAKA